MMNKLIVALLLTMGLNAHASTLKVDSVILNDDSIVAGSEVSTFHIFPYINTVDYIDLKEGSRIESSDIKKVIFKNHFNGGSSKPGIEFQARAAKVGGDGSGG